LFLVLVAGLALFASATGSGAARRSGLPVALLGGALLFLALAAVGRSGFVVTAGAGTSRAVALVSARQSRYVYMAAALVLPAIALACEAILRRHRYAALPLAALLLVGIPGNVRQFSRFRQGQAAIDTSVRDVVLRTPRLPVARALPQSLQPTLFAPGVTVGWLRDALDEGRLPRPPRAPRASTSLTLRLALQTAKGPSEQRCRALANPVTKTLEKGAVFTVARGSIAVVLLARGARPSFPVVVKGAATRTAIVGPLEVRISPVHQPGSTRDPVLCI
jgi:hypothetical protein